MITIRVHRHPLDGESPRMFEARSIGEWLLEHYGPAPAHGVYVYAGEPSAETDLTGNVPALLKNDAPLYVVLEAPGEPISLTAILTNLAVSMVISVIAQSLFAPDKPLANRTQESPNNALANRENRVRIMERVEDIFGTVRSFPTMLMPTYRKYIDHQEVEYGLYCVTRGYATVSDVKDGDTLLSAIEGASAAIYRPFASPNSGTPILTIGDPISDPVLTVERSSSVEDLVLRAPNQVQIEQNLIRYFFYRAGWEGGGGAPANPSNDMIFQPPDAASRKPNFNSIAQVGQQINILTEGGTYDELRTIAEVGDGYVLLEPAAGATPDFNAWFGPEFLVETRAILGIIGLSEWTDWYTLPQVDRTEVWFNMVARGGVFKDDGSKQMTTVGYDVQVNRLDPVTLAPTGDVQVVSGSITADTSRQRAETLELVTSWVGPARVRARRSTDYDYDFAGAVVDEITWMDAYAVTPVTKPHFGNKTTIHTVTRATPGSAAVSRRELNCLAQRLLPIYDGAGGFSGTLDADGLLASGFLAETSRIVDILAAVTVDPKIGGRDISELDLAQVWSVQQALDAWHAEVGQFNYTFDSDALSYEETVKAIADAAFCRPYRQNGVIRLSLDRPQANSVGLFTHRNKAPDAETITRRFANDADYDGVELNYVDPATESQETIRLPVDGSAAKPKKIEVSGIRSYEQAWFRANREYQRLRFERLSIESTVTTDARALLPNSRVDIVDNTRFKSFDGEVIGQSGLELTLSQPVEFIPAEPHSIVLKKRDGGIQSIAVTAGSAPNKVVLAGAPAEALVTYPDPDEGVRTEFSFAADSARGAQAWLVQELEITEDGLVKLRAVNYSADYYAADEEAIPPKDSVIN